MDAEQDAAQPQQYERRCPYIVTYKVAGKRVQESFDLGHTVRVKEIVQLSGGRQVVIDAIAKHPVRGGADGAVTGHVRVR